MSLAPSEIGALFFCTSSSMRFCCSSRSLSPSNTARRVNIAGQVAQKRTEGGLTEGELLERAIRRLGEEEPDDADLEEEEDAVGDVVLPPGVRDPDRVDELVEEAGRAAPPLEDGDTLRARVVWEELDEVCCSRRHGWGTIRGVDREAYCR